MVQIDNSLYIRVKKLRGARLHLQSKLILWGEALHQPAAASRDFCLVQRVKSLLAYLSYLHQPGLAQDRQVVRNGGLGHVELLNDRVDREPMAAAQQHDLLAGFIRQGFCKEDGVWVCHIDLHLFDII